MSATINITEAQTISALASFLLACLPSGVEVVRAQDNRVPEPKGSNFVTMTPILRERLATNTDTTTDGYPDAPGVLTAIQPVRVTIQVDVHGPASADNAQTITTLFRDGWGVDKFAATGFTVAPLYCSDQRQLPFENGEHQIEERYSIDCVMQANPIITVSQDFADKLGVGLIEVDAVYPPA